MFSELVNEIITLLKNNIVDPNTARAAAGKNWIFPDFPYEKSSMPRISVVYLGHTEPEYYGVNGGMILIYPLRYEISIWTRMGEAYTIDSVKYSGSGLLDVLADKIVNVMENNQFSIDNVLYCKCVGGRMTEIAEKDTGLMRKPLEFTFWYHKKKGE